MTRELIEQMRQVVRYIANDLKVHPSDVLDNPDAAQLIFAVVKQELSFDEFKQRILPLRTSLRPWEGIGYSSYLIAQDYISLATTGKKHIP